MPINRLNFSLLLSPHLLRIPSCPTAAQPCLCSHTVSLEWQLITALLQLGADDFRQEQTNRWRITPFIFSDIHFSWATADDSLYRSRYTWSVTRFKGCTHLSFTSWDFFLSLNWMDGELHVRFLVVKVVCSQRKERSKLLAPSNDYMKESLSSFSYSITWHRPTECHTLAVPIGQQPAHPLTTVFLSIFLCALISVTHLQHSHSLALHQQPPHHFSECLKNPRISV